MATCVFIVNSVTDWKRFGQGLRYPRHTAFEFAYGNVAIKTICHSNAGIGMKISSLPHSKKMAVIGRTLRNKNKYKRWCCGSGCG